MKVSKSAQGLVEDLEPAQEGRQISSAEQPWEPSCEDGRFRFSVLGVTLLPPAQHLFRLSIG